MSDIRYLKSKVTILIENYVDMITNEFHSQCSSLTGLRDFQMVDKLYMGANQVLCTEKCLCDASKIISTLIWDYYVTLNRPRRLGQEDFSTEPCYILEEEGQTSRS